MISEISRQVLQNYRSTEFRFNFFVFYRLQFFVTLKFRLDFFP